ncbi:hypothetical protein, partial [Arthrobacter sp. TMN-50]
MTGPYAAVGVCGNHLRQREFGESRALEQWVSVSVVVVLSGFLGWVNIRGWDEPGNPVPDFDR